MLKKKKENIESIKKDNDELSEQAVKDKEQTEEVGKKYRIQNF